MCWRMTYSSGSIDSRRAPHLESCIKRSGKKAANNISKRPWTITDWQGRRECTRSRTKYLTEKGETRKILQVLFFRTFAKNGILCLLHNKLYVQIGNTRDQWLANSLNYHWISVRLNPRHMDILWYVSRRRVGLLSLCLHNGTKSHMGNSHEKGSNPHGWYAD